MKPSHFKSYCALRSSGFSLIELLITIGLMGILMSAATFSFNSWQTKNRIEAQTREILTNLEEARIKSFTQKKIHGIIFKPSSYVMRSYSTESQYSPIENALTRGDVISTSNLKYGLTLGGTTADITNATILFDTTGFTSAATGFTVVVNPVSAASSVNCLAISAARVNMGKWNETTSKCDFK
jgi:prepilin-type N-terminal cleavage/methylation domain-containing protein